MDKPKSLSVKEYLIRKLAVKLMVSEKTLEAVINHQFNSANDAMKVNNTVEISGFGKFVFNEKKAQKKMKKMLSQKERFEKTSTDESLSEKRRATEQVKLANIINSINSLKPKIYEHKTDFGGMEEQHSTTVQTKGTDK